MYLRENSLSLADLKAKYIIVVSKLPSKKITASKELVLQIVLYIPEVYFLLSSSKALLLASSK